MTNNNGYVCESDNNCIEEHKTVTKTILKNCKTVRIWNPWKNWKWGRQAKNTTQRLLSVDCQQ